MCVVMSVVAMTPLQLFSAAPAALCVNIMRRAGDSVGGGGARCGRGGGAPLVRPPQSDEVTCPVRYLPAETPGSGHQRRTLLPREGRGPHERRGCRKLRRAPPRLEPLRPGRRTTTNCNVAPSSKAFTVLRNGAPALSRNWERGNTPRRFSGPTRIA